MEPNIYEDPGQYSASPPPPIPPPTIASTVPKHTTVTVERGEDGSPTGTANPFSCHFEDTFKEASGPKVPEDIHSCYKLTYSRVLAAFYIFLSVLIGPILVVLFAIVLGMTSFTITWVLSPTFRCFGMCFTEWERFITDFLNCSLAPYCRVMGGCCSKMVIRYQKVPPGEVIHI